MGQIISLHNSLDITNQFRHCYVSTRLLSRCMRTMFAMARCEILLMKDSIFSTTTICPDGSYPNRAATSVKRTSKSFTTFRMLRKMLQHVIGRFCTILVKATEWCVSLASSNMYFPCRALVGWERGRVPRKTLTNAFILFKNLLCSPGLFVFSNGSSKCSLYMDSSE